jgi:hypothetical protein
LSYTYLVFPVTNLVKSREGQALLHLCLRHGAHTSISIILSHILRQNAKHRCKCSHPSQNA